jgi:hypothetical protein
MRKNGQKGLKSGIDELGPRLHSGREVLTFAVQSARERAQSERQEAMGQIKSAQPSEIESGLTGEGLRRRFGGQREPIGQSAVVVLGVQIVRVGFVDRTGPRLSGCDQPEIMLGVLKVILRRDGIAPRMSVSRQLEIFLCDVPRGSAYFDVRPVRLVCVSQWVMLAVSAPRATLQPAILVGFHLLS